MRSKRIAAVLMAAAGLIVGAAARGADDNAPVTTPRWIWAPGAPKEKQSVVLRKEFKVASKVKSAKLYLACDDSANVHLDGKSIFNAVGTHLAFSKDLTAAFAGKEPGAHILGVRARNDAGPAAFLARLVIDLEDGGTQVVVTDASWDALERRGGGIPDFDPADKAWVKAAEIGKLGDAPYVAITEESLAKAAPAREATATDPSKLKVAKDFKVELLYSVPKDEQGSWVCMTLDPKGRMIASDQYGKLYRVTLPALDGKPEDIKVEPIPVEIGEAQGLLWAFDSLYVVVNSGGKFPTGLYRVRDTNGDDVLDNVQRLRELPGGAGEHGPHAIMLTPDGKSLVMVVGNQTAPVEVNESLVPRAWSEDILLPRMPDGNGFMAGVLAPGGCVYKINPDGTNWELVSMGFRNQYDAAFNRDGELFTYDSDMEWDINTPWYRPTRVCHVVSGSEFGWRNGAGVWPPYYADSLPGAVNVGPGSPTGVTFGYGAKFPAKYQDALFICDWSYGKLYATHLKSTGSTYTGELEEFVTGVPLPLTDIIVNPADGALYYTIGGRRTKSGLYRVTYTGSESTAPSTGNPEGAAERKVRRDLEAFHGHVDPKAVDAAWPHLGSPDRFLRWAARVAIETQPAATWQDRALAEKSSPTASIEVLIALARLGDKSLQPKLLEALDRIEWNGLTEFQQVALLRAYSLAFTRMGRPADQATIDRLVKRFDPHFPGKARQINSELCKLLVYLEAPSINAKATKLLDDAPTQEEQLDYATSLRTLKKNWTLDERKAFFNWLLKAANYRGGASFGGFLRIIREDAIATLSESEKASLKETLEAKPVLKEPAPALASRPLVKEWTVDELVPLVESKLKDRDFDRGRSLFGGASCFACHRFDNEGGAVGPDLTVVSGRFGVRDLLESVLLPSKVVSDQYQAVVVETLDGRTVTGRIVNLNDDSMSINTNMLDPNGQVSVDRKLIETVTPSPTSMMPQGLLNTLKEEEILDLVAYLLSRGDRSNAMFRQERAAAGR
ncbi:c-type cytochrome [Isosphaeraceae bacterium EP7]